MIRTILVLVCAGAVLAAPMSFRWTNQRVGPVDATTTRAQASKFPLPEGELTEGTSLEEGGDRPVTVLWELTRSRRVQLLWRRDAPQKLDFVRILGSEWKGPEGIAVGTPLSRLRQLNGRPIRLYAFDDGPASGSVLDWGKGKLAPEFKRVRVVLTPQVPGYNALSGGEKESLEASRTFSSEDDVMRRLNPVVSVLEVQFSSL